MGNRPRTTLGRRTLLVAGGAAAASGALVALGRPRLSAEEGSGTSDLSTWEGVRHQFFYDPDYVHLGAMFMATHPRPVHDAIARHREGLQRSPVRYVLENDTPLRLEAVAEAAAFFGASRDNVSLTGSTTEALSILYNGVKLEGGDEVVLEESAYYSTVEALRYKTRRTGAVTKRVAIHDGDPAAASEDEIVDRLMDAVSPRTRVMALTWVHSDTGLKLPIAQIAKRVGQVNRGRSQHEQILLCVDGVHGFGVEAVSLGELGCHFFAAGTHKWLFGPRGTGVLYAAHSDLWDRLIPTVPAFGVQTTPGLIMSPGGFHAFEHRWALPDAFRFITAVGMPRIAARIRALASRLKEGLAGINGVRLFTPASPELSAGIVAFTVNGMDPEQTAERLLAKKIVVVPSTYGTSSVRATPSFFNTEAEVDALLDAVRAL